MCERTQHTISNEDGQASRVNACHSHAQAIQYDFYIPDAIWNADSTKTFLQRLLSVESGATVFNGLTGVWGGTPEGTRIYRMILRAGQFDRNNARTAFRAEIGNLMAKLSVTPESQKAVLFSETEVIMCLSSMSAT